MIDSLYTKMNQEHRIDFLEFKNTILTKAFIAMGCALISIFMAGGSWFVMKDTIKNMTIVQIAHAKKNKESLLQKVDVKEHTQIHININAKIANLDKKLNMVATRIEKSNDQALKENKKILHNILTALKINKNHMGAYTK